MLVKGNSEEVLPNCFAVNLLEKPLYIKARGDIFIVGVRLYPFICLGFLNTTEPIMGLPPSLTELYSAIVQVITKNPAESVLELFEDYFSSSLKLFDTDSRLLNSCREIIEKKGVISASAISGASFTTNRTMERIFRKMIGQTPKGLARKVRFEFIRNFLWNHPDTDLTDLAYSLNFTDLAHLSNDFRRFSNQSPSDFIEYVRKKKKLLI